LRSAEVARRGGAKRLCVGSEMLSREHERKRWKALIDRVRMDAPELELMYSANWDHFEPVSFWDLVDVVGLTAYWELTKNLDASEKDLTGAWGLVKPKVLDFSRRLGRPLVFTEIGYPSLDGGAAWPWDETRKAPVDLEEQRRAYLAVVRAWSDTRELRGIYFWNWFGFGGAEDTNYTPRGKPAAAIVRDWYGPPK
jgi:beta-mannanase